MLNVDRVWARVSQRPEMRGQKLSAWGYQGVVLQYNGLTTGQEIDNQKANFPSGAIILGITMSASPESQAATQTNRPGLDMFAFNLQFQQNRTLVGQAKSIASAVLGQLGDQFPASEIIIPTNGFLLYGFLNLTTTTLDLAVTHHCLVPVNVG